VLQSFDGTEVVFRLICFLSNLVALFKREVTRNESPRLATLRTDLLVVGAIVGADGRKTVLRLGLRGARRERRPSCNPRTEVFRTQWMRRRQRRSRGPNSMPSQVVESKSSPPSTHSLPWPWS